MATASHTITIDTIFDWMVNVWWIWIIGGVFFGARMKNAVSSCRQAGQSEKRTCNERDTLPPRLA
jgi:uncharacterized membrane protein YecN with MAPEG domain